MTPSTTTRKVWATLPPEIHEYFFRKVLAGEHRAKQDLTAEFYRKLYEECRRRNIPEAWSTANIKVVADIMSKLNFTTNDDTNGPRCPAPAAA